MQAHRAQIVWSADAEGDLTDIWTYIAEHATPDIADRQLISIDGATAQLADWPNSGRSRDEVRAGLRSLSVVPYVLFYRVRQEVVEVVRVIHSARDVATVFATSRSQTRR